MDLYNSGLALEIRYPIGLTEAQHLAEELAARLDDLVFHEGDPPDGQAARDTFSGKVHAGLPNTDIEAIYIGRQEDWSAPWWTSGNDFGIKVVSGSNCLNQHCTGNELHIIARDYQLLLRAVWMALHEFGWRHYRPNGVPALKYLWVYKEPKTRIRTHLDKVWAGAVDHLNPSIAGGMGTPLGWSDGTNHNSSAFPAGLQEGDLTNAMGRVPSITGDPDTWLRHMGWTSSTSLQTGTAWVHVIQYDESHGQQLLPWDPAAGQGHYTELKKLYTDSEVVRGVALEYAQNEVSTDGIEWVSLARPDNDSDWGIYFGDPAFKSKSPVTRQIELANHVALSSAFANTGGAGIVIQAYGRCAEQPDPSVLPARGRVCVLVVETFRPAGRTIEDVIGDYKDASGNALCPLGLYQTLHTSAWHLADITSAAGSPELLVAAANRVRALPPVSPKILGGEAMPEFGCYGLGYYCYMRMILDIGCVSADFTLSDFKQHANQFLTDMFPTQAVRKAVGEWHNLLIDRDHKPLLHAHLVRGLWDELQAAMDTTTAGSEEEKRVVELCKYTRFLDLRNRYEAVEAAGSCESHYDRLMECTFRIRDEGHVDSEGLFRSPLHVGHHTALGLGTIYAALKTPPGNSRGSGNRPAWLTTVPSVDEIKGTGTNTSWIADGIANNSKHGLNDTSFSTSFKAIPVNAPLTKVAHQPAPKLLPYRTKGKLRLWLIPGSSTFSCIYYKEGGNPYVEFINQATGKIEVRFEVKKPEYEHAVRLTAGQLYEIRLTTYDMQDYIWLDWWTNLSEGIHHHLAFDPGREGDPSGFLDGNAATAVLDDRSCYFLIPEGVTEIHFYASKATNLQLFMLDSQGMETRDTSFQPVSRDYQAHPVGGTGLRIARIAGLKSLDPSFWLLNCLNLFSLHPNELLVAMPKGA